MVAMRCETFAVDVPPRTRGERVSAFVLSEDGPGTPALLLPAFGLDGSSFAALAPSLAGRRAVAWSPRNDVPAGIGLDGFAKRALDAAERSGLGAPCVLIGSSFGGMIALAAALAAPERVAGLVLIGTAPSWRSLGLRMRVVARLQPFFPRRSYHRRLARIMIPGRGNPPGGDPRRAVLRAQFERRTKDYVSAVLHALRDGADGPFDLSPRLPELEVPLLVLQGMQDLVALPRVTRVYDGAPNVRRVEFKEAGHLPQVFSPELLDGPLRAFLAELDAR